MRIFLTGATGYIGGTVANRLIAAGHTVVGLARSPEKAEQAAKFGIETVVGDLDDAALLAKCSGEADAVVSAANADHRASVEAMLAALANSNKAFIHTSGSGIVADCAGGELKDAVYEDDTPVDPKPARVERVAIINDIRAAAKKGVKTVVIAPPMIYGHGTGAHRDSIQIPGMINAAKKHGGARYVGAGTNAWSNVHVEDLAELYLLALQKAPAGAFYYAENGENSMGELAAAIHAMLGLPGQAQSMSLKDAEKEYGELFANYSHGSNSRVRAVRARDDLGWQPMQPSLLDELRSGCYRAEHS